MLAICAALSWEIRPILRVLGPARRTRYGVIRAWESTARSQPVVVFRTGIGCEAAAEASRRVLGALPVRTVINTGCAGALAPDLAVGAVVIPNCLLDPADLRHDADDACVNRLRKAALEAGLPINDGPILTSPRALGTVAEKSRGHARSGATAVEMEGYAIATVARAHGVRFGSARAILDTSEANLPVGDAAHKVLDLALRVASGPAQLPTLAPSANAVNSAQTSLEQLFRRFLAGTRPD